jgi:hypothetical protein
LQIFVSSIPPIGNFPFDIKLLFCTHILCFAGAFLNASTNFIVFAMVIFS